MKPRVYIETTVISYLTAWGSPHLMLAAQQETTRLWWGEQRDHYDLFISEVVLLEASAGDPSAAKFRLDALRGIPELEITDDIRDLAQSILKGSNLPEKAKLDALHIAIATMNGMDYLLTWNCRHIANATLQRTMRETCAALGLMLPVICTPTELVEVNDDD